MRMRRSFRRGPRRVRKRPVWVNIPFSLSFTETAGTQLLLTPEDWEAQFTGNSNEHAQLTAIRGELAFSQTTGGTLGGYWFWGIYLADKLATVYPTFATTGMDDFDWLLTGSRPTQSAVTSTGAPLQAYPIDIKSKRKMSSRDAIYISAQFASDAASPAATIGGLLRFLITRD